MSQNQIVSVPFNGEFVVAALIDGTPYVPMKPICNNLGLQWESQYNRIQRNRVLKASIFMMNMQMPGDDQNREMLCLPLKLLNGWLFGVDTNRVKEHLREKLETYQAECFDVLARHFMPAVVAAMQPEPKPTPRAAGEKVNPGDMQHIKCIVWMAGKNFHFSGPATQGFWYYLRQATNNPAPNAYTTDQIPVLAAELRRIVNLSEQIGSITRHVEEQAIKRIFRKGETADKVLHQLTLEAQRRVQQLTEHIAEFPAWMETDLLNFTERRPAHQCDHYSSEQPDFFLSAT